jgi:hypothetical protein
MDESFGGEELSRICNTVEAYLQSDSGSKSG